MYKKLIGPVVIACSFSLSPTVFAATSTMCPGEGLRHMVESINLNAEQKEKVKPILQTLKTNIKTNGSEMRDLSKQINEQAVSSSMDTGTVNGLIDKKVKLMGDLMKAKVDAKHQIFSVLTDEQKAKLRTMSNRVEERMAEHMKNCQEND